MAGNTPDLSLATYRTCRARTQGIRSRAESTGSHRKGQKAAAPLERGLLFCEGWLRRSPCNEEQPRCSNQEKYEQAEHGC
jgi:hypothetical protein